MKTERFGTILLFVVVFSIASSLPGYALEIQPTQQLAAPPVSAVPVPSAPGPYYAPPAWDQKLPSSSRFIILSDWGNAAVLDKETGLVWEKSPSQDRGTWAAASAHCVRRLVGNRKGWRLPTIQELASLIDMSVPSIPKLPAGHPFSAVTDQFWSVTTNATNPGTAWCVWFNSGLGVISDVAKGYAITAWCVRGGSGVDAQ